MAAANTDKFMYVGKSTATTLSSPGYTVGNTSINVASTTNWPTASGVMFAIDETDADGARVSGTYNVFRGTVASGTQIDNLVYVGGDTNRNYSAGATTRVYILVSADRDNRLVDGILVEHNQDGTHALVTPTLSTSINDTNDNELIRVSATASAVNEVTVTNAATGNAPSISATGGDTNINLDLKPKGTGHAVLYNPVAFSAYGSGATTLPNVAFTTITYDTEDYDLGGNFASNTFTAPYNGVYKFTATNGVDSINDGKIVVVAFLVNSTLYRLGWSLTSTTSTDRHCHTIARDFKLNAGDTVVVQVYHNYGSNRSSVSGETYCNFSGHLVART